MPVDRHVHSRAAPQFAPLLHEQHRAGPVRADDVILRARSEQTGVCQQHDAVDRLRRSMIAEEIHSRGKTQGGRLPKPQSHAPPEFDDRAVAQRRSMNDIPSADASGSASLQQMPFARPHDHRVLPLQVGEQCEVCWLARVRGFGSDWLRPADRNAVIQTQPKTTHSVDPQREHRPLCRGATIRSQWMTEKREHDVGGYKASKGALPSPDGRGDRKGAGTERRLTA